MNLCGKVLPNRYHIVLTNNKDYKFDDKNVKIVNNIEEISNYIGSKEEVFVIGGASIYKMLMKYAKKMYITKIYEDFDADTYFPEIKKDEWIISNREMRYNR